MSCLLDTEVWYGVLEDVAEKPGGERTTPVETGRGRSGSEFVSEVVDRTTRTEGNAAGRAGQYMTGTSEGDGRRGS